MGHENSARCCPLFHEYCHDYPRLAPLGERVPLPCFATPDLPLQPANIGYCLFARNYVRLAVRTVLERIARTMPTTYPETTVMYLDGNFPFLNGFPL